MRWEELDDLIQVSLLGAALTGELSLDRLQQWRETRMVFCFVLFLKKKHGVVGE